MIKQAEKLWESFLEDMFDPYIEAFHEFVYGDEGDEKMAHLILFAWMLGYQEAAELSPEDQKAMEDLLDAYIAEHRAEEAATP